MNSEHNTVSSSKEQKESVRKTNDKILVEGEVLKYKAGLTREFISRWC
jgi:hypothetical protein